MDKSEERIRCDRFEVDLRAHEIVSGGRRVRVQDKPLRVLAALAERAGEVVPRAELCDALWPRETHVEREAGLNTAIRKLRDALQQAELDRELIETVPRVGYRLRCSARLETLAGPAQRRMLRPTALLAATARSRPLAALAVTVVVVAAIALIASATDVRPTEPELMPATPELRARYIEARALLSGTTEIERARTLLESILEQAPEFIPARAYLAEASARVALRTGSPGDLEIARAVTDRALRLAPQSPVALRTDAMIALHFDRDVSGAEAGLARAIERAPDDPVTHLTVATYESILGRHDAAIAAVRRAVELAPEVMSIRSDAGFFLLRAGRYREAIAECEMVLRLDPDMPFARDCLIAAHARAGDPEGARELMVRAMEAAGAPAIRVDAVRTAARPEGAFLEWELERLVALASPPPVQIAGIHLALGARTSALTWLERAAAAGSHRLLYVPGSSAFEPLRGDPRYEAVIESLRLRT